MRLVVFPRGPFQKWAEEEEKRERRADGDSSHHFAPLHGAGFNKLVILDVFVSSLSFSLW